ncbi:FAD-binding oxidoreductase [Bauldia litoralis]|uniref:FAD/FMN-containing dehydrogenase n=1 Tax=Bauldia litoralis TaxID=665467 RepID=A0A1G6AIC9_9HYPH|nr:FAD-binding protein [Bauldia litoralis]SDB08184.1 FAD/FMN-containing dehydrogenase [Bauldia litoralis]
MEALTASPINGLREALSGIAMAEDPATLRLKSRDFFWFSPILKPLLEGREAALVAMPRTRDEVIRIAAAAARHRVPVTVRGGGTGNYGQAVPLEGGLLLDLSGLDRVVWARPGVGRFEAGARLLEIDRALRDQPEASGRWELRFHPSTRKQATIGGFIAGGAAGCGSCTWGQISDPGAVLAVQVVTLEETPRVLELRGSDVLKVLHAYGVNGIITEIEVPLAPWQPWAERILAFPTLGDAARFGWALAAAEGIAKKEIGIFDRRIPPMLKRVAPLMPGGQAMAIVMVSEPQAAALADCAADHGGSVVYERDPEEAEGAAFDGKGTMPPLYEYTWNHTTLHALKVESAITYLQVRFPEGGELALVEAMEKRFGDELLLHLEFQRRFGRVFVSSLPLLRFRSPERLGEIVAEVETMGGAVSNPHTYVLDNAGWKRTDAPQARFKALADPHGLMNPGKLLEQTR